LNPDLIDAILRALSSAFFQEQGWNFGKARPFAMSSDGTAKYLV
jgi:hypothetical protein